MTAKKSKEKSVDVLLAQYKIASDDMRFLSDQRFKIVTVFLAINAVLFNVAAERLSIVLGLFGCTLSFLCLAWDARTSQWWGTLINTAKFIEAELQRRSLATELYSKYRQQNPMNSHRYWSWQPRYIRASRTVFWIYNVTGVIWLLYVVRAAAGCFGFFEKSCRLLALGS